MFDVHFLQTGSNFDSELSSAEVLLVNFYAPWYVSMPPVNCRRLFLSLSDSVAQVPVERAPGPHLGSDRGPHPRQVNKTNGVSSLQTVTFGCMYPMTTVKVARVDCTDPSVQLKCREHHINAFPTVRVYRKGNNQVRPRLR